MRGRRRAGAEALEVRRGGMKVVISAAASGTQFLPRTEEKWYSECHRIHRDGLRRQDGQVGRIVIPKNTRAAHGLRAGTKFLPIEDQDSQLWLQKLDAQELARQIQEDFKGIDLRPLLDKAKSDMDALDRERYLALRR